MEQESFENNTIAELLNREYICVKVDREERPDVDAVYMSVCQALNGQGGWPLTIIMTPACRPFFSGTYLPPKARDGRVGLEELLTAVAGQWKTNRGKLLDSAGRIEAYLKEQERATVSAEPGMDLVHQAFRQFAGNFDKKNGGFGGAPKFPTPHNLMFLMKYGTREKKREALTMAETTLVQMYRGGIFDHIGGGFSRYSTSLSSGIFKAASMDPFLYSSAGRMSMIVRSKVLPLISSAAVIVLIILFLFSVYGRLRVPGCRHCFYRKKIPVFSRSFRFYTTVDMIT